MDPKSAKEWERSRCRCHHFWYHRGLRTPYQLTPVSFRWKPAKCSPALPSRWSRTIPLADRWRLAGSLQDLRHRGSSSNPQVKGQPITLPFREDFSLYEDGDGTPWGPGGKAKTGSNGRKWLMPVGSWQKTIAPNVHEDQTGRKEAAGGAGWGRTDTGRTDVELPQRLYRV